MPQYGDQPTITVIRKLKLTGFEIVSCYTGLSWELDIKLEKGKKRFPDKRNTKRHVNSNSAAHQKVQKPVSGRTF